MWLKLDDRFAEHPKISALSDPAFRLHIAALCFSARNETEGCISRKRAVGLAFGEVGLIDEVTKLVPGFSSPLWEKVSDGYVIHDFAKYNPARTERQVFRDQRVRAGVQRAKDANRQADGTFAPAGTSDHPATPIQHPAGDPIQREVQPSPSPSPSLDPTTDSPPLSPSRGKRKLTKSQMARLPYSIDFERFWDAYPKKIGKGDAWVSWQRMEPPLEKALSTLAWQTTSARWVEEGYVPNGSTYINQRRWDDEPPGYASQGKASCRRGFLSGAEEALRGTETTADGDYGLESPARSLPAPEAFGVGVEGLRGSVPGGSGGTSGVGGGNGSEAIEADFEILSDDCDGEGGGGGGHARTPGGDVTEGDPGVGAGREDA